MAVLHAVQVPLEVVILAVNPQAEVHQAAVPQLLAALVVAHQSVAHQE